MLKRNKIIKRLVNEGFTYKTLSLFSDRQIKELASRILGEANTSRVEKTTYSKAEVDKMKQDHGGLTVDGTVTPNEDGSVTVTQELGEDNIEDDKEFEKTHPKTKKIDTEAGELDLVLGEMDLDDRHPNREGSGEGKSKTDGGTFEPVNYDVTKPQPHSELSKKKELTHTGDGYIHEEFKSKDQQKYFFWKCEQEGPKSKWCKMADEFASDTKDFSNLPEKVQSEMIEEWVTRVVEKEHTTIKVTKGKLIEMISDNYRLNYDSGKIQRTDLFDSMEQQIAFENLNKWILDKEGFQLNVDELEKGEDSEESVLLMYLKSDSGKVWDIKIYTDGNIYMDDAPINDIQDFEEEIKEKETHQEGELAETERDTEGEYIGAPVDTQMPVKTPVRTPTTTPIKKPGRPGPFKRPQTTPKPKAKDKKVPEWFNFDKIKSQVEKK